MQHMIKAKVVNLLQEKTEAYDASDESSYINESEANLLQEKIEVHEASDESSDINESELNIETNFIFYTKQAIMLAETVINSLNGKLVPSNFQNDALKNLFIWYEYNSALPASAAIEPVLSTGKDILLTLFASVISPMQNKFYA